MEHVDLGIPGLSELTEIGRGGSAVVYKAWQEDLGRHVAVKVIHTSADEGVRRRFDRERQAMGRLSEHPGIAQVHSTGETRTGELYLVMPFYSDGPLSARLANGASLPWREAIGLLGPVAKTIGDAHAEGIVHRDLKPANILLTSAGEPRVADFGIAVLTASGEGAHSTTPSFTPFFAAPEVFQRPDVSPAVDVYSLGATLYAMLSGRPPFHSADGANDVLAVMRRVAEEDASDLDGAIPKPLQDLISRSMSKNPERRPADGHAFLAELDAAVEEAETGEPASTIIPPGFKYEPTPEPESTGASRIPLVLLGTLVAIAAVVGIVAISGGDADGEAAPVTVAGAPRVIGLDVVDLTDTTARVVYRGDVCTGTRFEIVGINQGGSGFPDDPNCNDSHQLLLGRNPFTPLLEPETEYTVKVEVIDAEGRVSAQESLTFETEPAAAEDRAVVMAGLDIRELQPTSATIRFSTDLCAGSSFYLDGELLHTDGYDDNENCWNQHSFPFGQRSDALEPNTSYVAKVVATSRFGVETIEEVSFTTPRG